MTGRPPVVPADHIYRRNGKPLKGTWFLNDIGAVVYATRNGVVLECDDIQMTPAQTEYLVNTLRSAQRYSHNLKVNG